jgi:hypothetical protein
MVITVLVARWNTNMNISLEEMQSHKSCDMQGGYIYRVFDGVCASNCATYLLYLIGRSIFNENGKLYSCYRTKKSLGEIILMDAEDTGIRCMDGQPVVKPTAIIKRIPVTDFLDWKRLKYEQEVFPGVSFDEIRDLLDEEHHQERPFSAHLKFHGYIELDEDEQAARRSMSRDEFKTYLQTKYNTVIKG